MGCKCSKVNPVSESTIRRIDNKNNADPNGSSTKTPINARQSNIRHDLNINKPVSTDDHVRIDAADTEAFHTSFVRKRQQAIDNLSYRSIIQSWSPESLQHLTEIIKEFSKGKSVVDRHWIVFYWIAYNIAYDTVSYFSKIYEDQTAEGVFRTRKGVCAGYANLYKYLCDRLEMPCEIVSGYAKGYGFDDRVEAPSETDHAWNAVEINGHWYLMESTWGAGHLNNQKTFERELNAYYFLPRPIEMIYHHLPENDKWQLLQTPINMRQYMQMPKVHPTYFDLNLELVSPRNQAYADLLDDKAYALVLIRAPSSVGLSAGLKLNDQKVDGGHRVVFDSQKQLHYCYFAPSTIGKHKITIFAKQRSDKDGSYHAAIDLSLNVQQKISNPISFPKTWESYFVLGLEVVSPRDTHLIKLAKGADHAEILIRAPKQIALMGHLENEQDQNVINGHHVYYDRRNDIWRCQFAPDRSGHFEAVIFAKETSDRGDYSAVISFKIQAKQIPSPPRTFPDTWQLFYDLGMQIESPRDQGTIVLSQNEGEVEILLRTPESVALLGRLSNENSEEIEGGQEVFYDQRASLWRCKFAPNRVGTFKALIMAKKKSDDGNYTSAISFQVQANQVPSPPLSYPHTWPPFYELGLKIEAPRNRANAVWPDNASYAEVLIQAPKDVQLSCSIEYNKVAIENGSLAQFDQEKNLWQLLFAPERTGRHELFVFAKRSEDNNAESHSVVKFNLDVTKLQRSMKFPLIYTQFETTKCRIYTPLQGIIKKGAVVPIHCVVPGANDVAVAIDSKLVESDGYSDPIFKRKVTAGSENVMICAKYGQDSSYKTLVKYNVQ